ncbi:uncharacterized protein BP5553_10357 [Venustampulla echinocandica]|uniref:Carrier domain-containing protein n=1 Tax=Venustampulla echinocandica TaxID=2656787 RepID=A0A370T9Z5_9HELO|nr:uncharacterized protein BP5553_10357 [Venustampulla echinocandica]RDL30479.1 hypothetical protein BP5553_10357 [Venustampulla echinocandica]
MGEYTEPTAFEIPAEESNYLQNETKVDTCYFPLLTNGVIIEQDASRKGLDMNRYVTPIDLGRLSSSGELRAFCAKHNFDAPALFQFAWSVVLASYIGTQNVNFIAVKSQKEKIEVGICEVELDDGASTIEALKNVEEKMKGSYSTQHRTPLSELQMLMTAEGRPAFNSVVVFQELDERLSRTAAREERLEGDFMCITVRETLSRVEVELAYPSSLLPTAQAQNVASTFSQALMEIVEQPLNKVGEIDLVGLAHLAQIWRWNKEMPRAISKRVNDLIEAQAKLRPEAQAVVAEDGELSYGMLSNLSTRLAHHLVGLGVGPENVVPLSFEKSKWAIVAMLGVIKAGAAIVNLDAQQPMARLNGLMDKLKATLVLTSQRYGKLWEDRMMVFVVDQENIINLAHHAEPPVTTATPNNILYVIFTSGSTGTPKGCVIEHESFLTAAAAHVKASNMTNKSRVFQGTPYTFDVSMLEIFTALSVGACVCSCGDEMAKGGIANVINKLGITWTFMTPSLVRLIEPADVPGLETLALGGEPLSTGDVRVWADRLHLVNGYGPTETSVAATINAPLSLETDPANIGRGVGSLCWIVKADDHNTLVPIGAVGELIVQGPIVARGYFQSPEKTQEVFIEDPPTFAEKLPGLAPMRLYKTGDLVRYNSDGTIQFIGRKDKQVKLRGQRLELGEIESHLSLDSHVRHALVVLPKTGRCKERLVAVLSLHDFPVTSSDPSDIRLVKQEYKDQSRILASQIRESISLHLTKYMVPTVWAILESLPLTTSGKINGRAVTQWLENVSGDVYNEIADVAALDVDETPTSDMEKMLQNIWSEVLNIPTSEIGLNRSFLSIGGDSISAMKMVSRCRNQHIDIAVKDIFLSKGLSELATRVKLSDAPLVQQQEYDTSSELSASQRIATIGQDVLSELGLLSTSQVEDAFICSPMQESIVLTRARFPGTYEIKKVIVLESQDSAILNAQHIRSAWQKVVDRHQSLRAVIVNAIAGIPGDAVFHQVVLKQYDAEVVQVQYNGDATPSSISTYLRSLAPPAYGSSKPEHRLTICNVAGNRSYLMIDVSHAVVDGISAEAILQDLALALEGSLPSGSGPLHGDYISHIQRLPESESIEYWKTTLGSMQPCIVPMYNGDKKSAKQARSMKVAFSQWDELVRFSEANGVTISNVVQTAWALTLRAYTGSNEVLFGYMASGRDLPVPGIESAVGVYLTMVVCHLAFNEAATPAEMAQLAQEHYVSGHPHQYTPLGKIQHAMNTQGMPLFNTIMSFYKPATNAGGDIVSLTAIDEVDPCEFDIAVGAYLSDNDLNISLGYWSSVISDGEMANIANTFSGAISAMLRGSQTIEELDLFNERDRSQVWTWNKQEPLAIEGVVHDYFHEQVLAQPDAPAVFSWDGEFTYRELDQFSNRLAFYLSYRGVGPEILVPHCFDKSKWATVVMVAIMKAGGAGVGLSPAHPVSRLSSIIENCDAKVTIVAPQHAHLFEEINTSTIIVDRQFIQSLPGVVEGSRLPKVHPSNPAFVSFTSGSTGKPKGIVLEHRSLITSIQAHGSEWGIGPGSRVIQFSAYAFDAAVSDTFTTLSRGGCVCIPSEHDRTNDLAAAMTHMEVNWAFLTPRVLGTLSPATVPFLKTVVLGGEAISSEDIDPWTADISLRIVYGPTECTIFSMGTDPLTPASDPTGLGHGVGTRVWITDSKNTDKLAPVGCIGEMLIEGPLVTRGYLNDPERTKISYIGNPKWMPVDANTPPRRFYKTGDLVRYLPDGDMMFIGRKDTQVKIRGQRVELGEIEHAILQNLDSVIHVTVDSVVFPASGQAIVAFIHIEDLSEGKSRSNDLVVPLDQDLTLKLRQLEKALMDSLPTYFVPSLFVPIRFVPMTISGKVDRIQLRQNAIKFTTAEFEMYSLANQHKRAPATEMESKLQQLWAEVLKRDLEAIGADDNFFRLGGDSIVAMKLVNVARAAGFTLGVADIFQSPELSKMAEFLETSEPKDGTTTTEAPAPFQLLSDVSDVDALLSEVSDQYQIPKAHIHDIYPCTPLQEALVAISTTQLGAYVAQNAFHLPADMDVELFKDAWQTMVDTHSILRTRVISPVSTRFLQVVLHQQKISWQEASSLDAYLAQDKKRPIVYGGELTRYGLVKDEKTGRLSFVWTVHHAVYDGWSVPLVLEQVGLIYNEGITPTEAPFNQFIKHLENTSVEDSNNFWRSQLSGETPASFPRLPNAAYQPRTNQTQTLRVDVSAKSDSDITLAIVLRAAWAIVVARYAESNDVVLGLTLSGRDLSVPGIQQTLGPTITTVPLKMHIDSEQTIANYLKDTQKQSIDMMPYQHTGLQKIKRVNAEAMDAANFKNLFVVQPQPGDMVDFLGLEEVKIDTLGFDTYALLVECNYKDNKVDIKASYDDNILPSDQVYRLLNQFEKVILQINEQSATTTLGQIDLFSAQDRKQVWAWNSVAPTSTDECVHNLIRQQVMSHPQAMAVESWDGNVTYQELDDLSSKMAYFLRTTLGVKPEVLVPMCFDKSVWTVVTMISVVKAGGACVMLNPEHPVTRLGALLSDIDSHVLLAAPQNLHLFETLPWTATSVEGTFLKNLPPVAPDQLSQLQVAPTNPAVIIFTSGSTGKPKGIIVQHNALCTVATQHGEGLGFGGVGSRVLQFANYTFDVSVGEIFITLMHGGTICIATEYDRINNLAGVIRSMEIDWTFMTPTVAALLDPKDVPNLKTLVLGGEAVSQSLVDRWSPHLTMIDSYGPAESTIWTSHAMPGPNVAPSNIGFGVGCRLWVVESSDHNRLTPVGCVGELLIEGPVVSRGYLKEPEKTKAAFIENPAWMQQFASGPHRFYKTGDLVRYNSDGSLTIAGRIDSQVKFHGQRIELGEIEFHIRARPEIEAGMVAMPKTGLCNSKLVAVIAITEFEPLALEGDAVALVKPNFKERAQAIVSDIRDGLSDLLPPYMVPTVWMVLDAIPLTASRKINRVPINKWIREVSKEDYLEIVDVTASKNEQPTTSMEKQLTDVWSHILDIPADNIGANRSFLSLGGDSITAMQVVSRCRTMKIQLSVEDILKSKSLAELASRAKSLLGPSISKDEDFDTPFQLSPVQQLYFNDVVPRDGSTKKGVHYNQNVLARFTRHVNAADVAQAITTIVKHHSMLRASFKKDNTGQWMQTVSRDISGSHVFESHGRTSRERMVSVVNNRQAGMDIQNGPIFAVDLFDMADGGQLISLCAHHLVIDLVSWRIILQNLEELLESKSMSIETPVPFQTLNRLQIERSKDLIPSTALPVQLPPADLKYWGMSEMPSWNDVEEINFASSEETTSLLFGTANESLKTEPVEIILAALQQSFRNTFDDRDAPAIFCEGHGRDAWGPQVDASGTVGWFTTFNPIHVSGDSQSDPLDAIRRTKDIRRKIPRNGCDYFSCRHFSPAGIESFRHHKDMEICFNYMGRYQQLERDGALIRQEALQDGEVISPVGEDARRLAVFDISAVVTKGQLKVSFFVNRTTQRMDKIHSWVSQFEQLLQSVAQLLIKASTQQTLSDFPLMSMDYDGLTSFSNTLNEIGVSSSNVEDLYPASAMQEGILISQAREPDAYKVRQIFKVTSNDQSLPIDAATIQNAWQKVVNFHALLRTIFLDSFDESGAGFYDQLVLKDFPADVQILQYDGEGEDVVSFLEEQPSPDYSERRPPHRITLCEATDGIYMHWEISHSLIDGTSMALVMRDFTLAFEDLLPSGTGPLYSDYIAYLKKQPESASLDFWTGYLADIEPCHFPSLRDVPPKEMSNEQHSIVVNLDVECDLQKFCEQHEITVGNLMQAAWGLVLKSYTGSDDVCFGYMAAGRDVPVEDIYNAVGPYINLLVCRLDLSGEVAVGQLLAKLQDEYVDSLPHQHTSLAKIQHALEIPGLALFNTSISLQRLPPPGPEPKIAFEVVDQMDPTEYVLSLDITTGGAEIEVVLTHIISHIPEDRAVNIANTFGTAIKCLMSSYDKTVGSLDLVSEEDKEQISMWSGLSPRPVDSCIHWLIEEQALAQPYEPAVQSWEGDATFTYHELNQAAVRFAQKLKTSGVGPEVLVPLCLKNSAWTIVAMLGVLKAGGAYVMLSPNDTRARLESLIKCTAASVVITSPQYSSLFSDMGVNVISIDGPSFKKLPPAKRFSPNKTTPRNAAMVVYTSGSTGAPRGTILEHRSICTMATRHGPTVSMTQRASVLQFAAYTSSVSNSEILTTLINGGCICIPSDDEKTNDISGAISRMDVNWAFLSPTVAKLVNPSDVPSLQTLVLGGEPVTSSLTKQWKTVQIVNSYGLSECSLWTSNAWQKRSGAVSPSNIGRGIASRLWIADPSNHNRLVPVGAVGELLIDGPLVARGYLETPEAESAFVTEPEWFEEYDETSESEPAHIFKTGDLVRYSSNGMLTFVGRKDSKVKLHGQAIDCSEIENQVAMVLPGSQQVAVEVVSMATQEGKHTLIAFFSENKSTVPNLSGEGLLLPPSDTSRKYLKSMQAELGKVLPQYMIPTVLVPLGSLPLTSSMKLNRRSLQDLSSNFTEDQLALYSLSESAKPKKSAMSSKGKTLSSIWAQALGVPVESIGANDHFFRLGGDSITAMKMVTIARTQGYSITVSDAFQNPQLSAMLKVFRKLNESTELSIIGSEDPDVFSLVDGKADVEPLTEEVAKQCGIDKDLIEDIYPCTPFQEDLMAVETHKLSTNVSRHVYEIPSNVDIPRFRSAWEVLFASSATLRTRIVNTEHGLFQVVLKEKISWQNGESLEQYLNQDKDISVTYGSPLTRYAIVGNPRKRFIVWTAHHSVYDEFTTQLVAQQITSIYTEGVVLEEVTYNKFVHYLGAVDPNSVGSFWRAQLAEESSRYPPLPSTTYQPRTNNRTARTIRASRIDSEVPLSNILRAAWAIVLSVHGNSEDVVFGATLPGRYANLEGSMQVMGPTVSTVPVQISLDRSKSVSDFLRQVNSQAVAMIPYEHTGLKNIQRVSKEAKDAVDFKNLLVIRPTPKHGYPSDFLGLTRKDVDVKSPYAYALVLECNLGENSVEVQVAWDRNVLPAEHIEGIMNQFELIVHQLNDLDMNSAMTVDQIETITAQDLQRIAEWNTERPRALEACVHSFFEEQALKQPNASAVESFDGNFTYALLNDMATRLSQFLVSRGVKLEDKIPICYKKSAWVIVAMFGIMKSGGTFVLLNPESPVDRQRGLINDLGSNMVLCDSHSATAFASVLPSSGVILMDEAFIQNLPVENIAPAIVPPSSAVLVQFTSGSTGKPKGIVLEHRSVCTGLLAHGEQTGMGTHTRTFQFASYTFDNSIEEILSTLMLGGTVCVPSDFDRMNDVSGAMARMRVNWADLTPTVAVLLDPSIIPTMETLVLSGESITKEVVELWADHVKLVNSYGPSECTVATSCNTRLAETRDFSNVGKGFGCTLWIVDPQNHNRLAPIGSIGELLIEGPIVAREYLNDPEKTAASFVRDVPWAKDMPGDLKKFYKTGDLVQYNADSTISFIGRRDNQVKLYGQRIELGEIEHQVKLALPDSTYQVAVEVLTPESRGKNKSLTAFFCQGNSTAVGTDNLILPSQDSLQAMLAELLSKLQSVLPAYMIPAMFIPVSYMPLSTSAKLDRKTLRQMGNQLSGEALASYSVSNVKRGATEKTTNGLGISSQPQTNPGLPSQPRTNPGLSSQPQTNPGRSFQPPTNFAPNTLQPYSLLPKKCDIATLRSDAARQCGVSDEDVEDIYPCTPLQEGLMALTARRELSYISRTIYRLPDSIDLNRFRDTWEHVGRTQSILRTRIVQTASRTFQVVVKDGPEWQSSPTLEEYTAKDLETPMTYGTPLIRYCLINGRDSQSDSFFVYTAHHSVYDGWSDSSLIEGIELAYTHGVASLPDVTQYNKFIQFLENTDVAASNKFWQNQLSGGTPTSFPRLLSPTFEPKPTKVQSRKLELPRTGSTFTLTTLLKAAWSMVLSQYSDSDDVIFDHVLSGRSAPVENIDTMIGPTLCTVPFRVRIDRTKKAEEFLSDIQLQSIEMMPFEQAGVQNIRRLPGVDAGSGSGNLFLIQPALAAGVAGPLGMEIIPTSHDDFETYALLLECHVSDSGPVELLVRFDEAVIDEGEVSWLLTHFEVAARNLLLNPSSQLNEMSLFSENDIHQLMEWVGPPVETCEACVHDLFKTQAELNPSKQAIRSWDGDFTYGQLDSLSTLISSHLRSIGVQQNSYVPLCFNKSAWAIVAMLAVLKAGAAIVMLNPEHPVARLREIVEETGANVILAGLKEAAIVKDLADSVLPVDSSLVVRFGPVPTIGKLFVSPRSPVYVVFTSGSTGKPKGVVIEHKAFVTSARHHSKMIKLNSSSRVLQFAAYTFDISMADIFSTLIVGGTVCVISDTDRTNNLVQAINNLDANWACLTATVAGLFQPSEVPSLKTLTLCGESPTEGNVSTWGGKVEFVNAYGPAEASVYCCIQSNVLATTSPTNIGTGSGLRVWITEKEDPQKLVPVGGVGEMLIEGPSLARGYLNDAGKTRAAFIENPLWMQNYPQIGGNRRLYRTGDMAKYNFDGTVEFCGRRDNQVKFNGQRLETQEIEHHIRSRLDRLDITVDAINLASQNDKKILVAFFYHPDNVSSEWTADELALSLSDTTQNMFVDLRSDLLRSIPSFMIPSLFIPLRGMPINTSFKLNRLVLRQLVNGLNNASFRSYALVDAEKKAPSTALEKQLSSLWASVLGTPQDSIGATDNFFQLGGDSISAMKLVGRLRSAGISMTIVDIFEHPRIVDAATFITTNRSLVTGAPARDISPYKPFSIVGNANLGAFLQKVSEKAVVEKNNIVDVLPTTTSQDIALVGGLTDSRWMLNHFYFDGNGPVDIERVRRSCFKLVQSLEILRTVFILHEGRFLQVVLESLAPKFSVYETDGDIDVFAQRLYEDSFNRDIPLEQPLIQFTVIKQLSSSKHRITMRLSHAQYDGVSISGIWETLMAAFKEQSMPQAPGFSRYAFLSNVVSAKAATKNHWTKLLAGSSMTSLVSRQAPELRKPSDKVATLTRAIRPAALSTPGLTFATTVKAAWSLTLANLSSKPDVVFGNTVNGRSLPIDGVEDIVGPCLNIVPVRVTLQSDWKIIDLLKHVQSQQLLSTPFESMGYRDIFKKCTSWPKWTYFSSIVQHQNIGPNEPIKLDGTTYEPGFMGTDLDLVDVSIVSTPLEDGSMEISLNYSHNIPSELAEELLEMLCEYTMSFSSNPNAPLPNPSAITQQKQVIPLAPKSPGSVASSRTFESLEPKEAAALQTVLKGAWSEVLESPSEIKLESSIFELGGDVVNVAQLAVLLRAKSFSVSVEDLVRFPTIEGQVELLSPQVGTAKQILG